MQIWFKNIIVIFIISIFIRELAFTQQIPSKKDSSNLYKNIETYSKHNKFNTFIYSLLFKTTAPVPTNKRPKKKLYKKLIKKPYSAFEGKIIRHINIETLDPFGFSIADTIVANQNLLVKSANKLHIKSQNITIRNLLLVHQNQPFDSLLVKESERLVRSQHYVRDVSFFVTSASKNSDSVDIFIRELDNWSIVPQIEAVPGRYTIILPDENFLGLGHEFINNYTMYPAKRRSAYNANYFIPNIRNTYVNTTIHYGTDEFGNFIKSFAIDRPFFSPFAKWAGGINLTQQFHHDSIYTNHLIYVMRKYKFNSQDYWGGRAVQIFKGTSEDDRTTNFISAVRFLRIRYPENPSQTIDSLHIYTNEDFYMISIGVSTRKYVQDKFIFNYGITEDVPIGRVYRLTGGYQFKNGTKRLYVSARISSGNYYTWGYLSSNLEYGTFVRSSHTEQGVITTGINYFTGLIEIGRWKFRQFVKPQLVIGINRYPTDSLTLNTGFGLDGFNSSALSGKSRLLFTLQTQSYAPWNFIGFRFGPFLNYSLGMLGNETKGFKGRIIYSQIGLGVLIKNENLVINTFQISIAFYPLIPGVGRNVFKSDPIKTTDFGFTDFEIGKPGITMYQ